EVVVGGQVLRRAAGRRIRDPQVRLTVGADWLAGQQADEGDAFAVGRHGEVAEGARDGRDSGDRLAGRRHAVQLGARFRVVRFGHASRREVDRRAVGRPRDAVLVEVAVGDLRRGRLVERTARRADGEDVRVLIAIDVGRVAVGAIDGLGDDLHVALVAVGLLGLGTDR